MKEKSKNPASDAGASTAADNDGIWKDPRFAHLVSDPRFRNIHKSTKTVKIDKRFKSMFDDGKFKVKYSVDKYGRRVNKTSTDDLEKYYDLSSDEENEVEEQHKEEQEILKDGGDFNEKHESDEEISTEIKLKLKDMTVDYARGEVPIRSDSSSDDESSDDGEDELYIEHVWGELDNDAPRTEESTRRLAVCNMDWDRMRAVDIMVLLSSFLPPGGSILKVTIYPSEFGKERMAEEEVKGPQELTENKLDNNDDSEFDSSDSEADIDENEDGEDYHMEKLRQYQLNRLKYYYAVIELNSIGAADKLYAECDGLEYESTATKLDLRFIPDDMTFDDQPKEICTEMPELSKYKPRVFTTTALQQAKVELTWDENDVDRMELNEKVNTGKLTEVPDSELRKFVAYSSEEEEEDAAEKVEDEIQSESEQPIEQPTKKGGKKDDIISKYKNLLNDINKKEEQKKKNRVEMEYSWGIDAADKPSIKSKEKAETSELTPFEKIIEKKREKKRARKQKIRELKKANSQSEDSGSDDDMPDGIDLNDPYFAEEFANGDFAPPKMKKEKSKKKKSTVNDDHSDSDNEKDLELLLDDDDNKKHFSLKKIQENENESKTSKKKRKNLKGKKKDEGKKPEIEDDFKINTEDKRFSAIYSSHLFNIDPTDSHFKKTKAMETLIQEKLKRKAIEPGDTTENGAPNDKKRKDVANSILVKSIKRKVQHQK